MCSLAENSPTLLTVKSNSIANSISEGWCSSGNKKKGEKNNREEEETEKKKQRKRKSILTLDTFSFTSLHGFQSGHKSICSF